MINFPNAKINLGLHVTSRLPSGYHTIETIFYPIPLCDALEAIPSDKFSFHPTGLKLDGPTDDNLVMKAVRLLYPNGLPSMEIHLLKAIPFGAGLGGGSSNAAFMLMMLNEMYSLGLSLDDLEDKASKIGADCPFFIRNRPVFAAGTGNIFDPIDLSLAGKYLILVKPPFGVSTAEAYSGITPGVPLRNLREVIAQPINEWRNLLKNDFEQTIISRYPMIGAIKTALYNEGALYASMSGSGSSVYGIFEGKIDLRKRFEGLFVWGGNICS